jgi:hypothetical protein
MTASGAGAEGSKDDMGLTVFRLQRKVKELTNENLKLHL